MEQEEWRELKWWELIVLFTFCLTVVWFTTELAVLYIDPTNATLP